MYVVGPYSASHEPPPGLNGTAEDSKSDPRPRHTPFHLPFCCAGSGPTRTARYGNGRFVPLRPHAHPVDITAPSLSPAKCPVEIRCNTPIPYGRTIFSRHTFAQVNSPSPYPDKNLKNTGDGQIGAPAKEVILMKRVRPLFLLSFPPSPIPSPSLPFPRRHSTQVPRLPLIPRGLAGVSPVCTCANPPREARWRMRRGSTARWAR